MSELVYVVLLLCAIIGNGCDIQQAGPDLVHISNYNPEQHSVTCRVLDELVADREVRL